MGKPESKMMVCLKVENEVIRIGKEEQGIQTFVIPGNKVKYQDEFVEVYLDEELYGVFEIESVISIVRDVAI